jgi:tetratricopeptide (TPR) repeat protein
MGLFFVSCDFTSGLHRDILKAQNFINEQKFKKAIEIYKNVLNRRISKNIQVKINFQLGDIYSVYLNQYDSSIQYYKKILRISDDPLWQVKAYEKIAQIYFENLRKFTQASKIYRILKDFKPQLKRHDFYEYRYILSIFNLGSFKESSIEFSRIASEKGHQYNVRANYYLGMCYYFQKKWVKAVNSWFDYIKREKRKDYIVQSKFMIANAYESAEKLKDAYNVYYSILGEYPNPDVIKRRLESLYNRRVARKR